MTTTFDFSTLERLKNYLTTIRRNHVSTMAHYVSEPLTGFWHQPDKRYKSSLSSTATCVSSLVNANLWNHEKSPLSSRAAEVAAELISKRTSALLDQDNPFSLSFVAEGVLDLIDVQPSYHLAADHKRKVMKVIAPKLVKHLMERDSDSQRTKNGRHAGQRPPPGSISIEPYPLPHI
jgi:hypothetical protein